MAEYDLAILGAGPGGYVAAIRAGQLGMKTALIEASAVGGMCLNWGCIPSKTMLSTARRLDQVRSAAEMGIVGIDLEKVSADWSKARMRMRRLTARLCKGVEYLLKKNQVELITARGEPRGGGAIALGDREIRAKKIILATGTRPATAALKAVESRILEIDRFWQLEELPAKAAVWGSGPVAAELALILASFGVETALVSIDEQLLPELDGDVSAFAAKRLKKAGVALHLGRHLAKEHPAGVTLDDGTAVGAEFLLNASERVPVMSSLQQLGLELEEEFVRTDEYGRCSVEDVYAVGDMTGMSMFAHCASAQGVASVNHIAGVHQPVDYGKIPWNIYLNPEIATIGLPEEMLHRTGIEYTKGIFPLTANSKAVVDGETDGFVKILADKKYGEVLGVHIVAPDATDMIGEAALGLSLESTAREIAGVIHPHPTFAETILEASLGTWDEARHI